MKLKANEAKIDSCGLSILKNRRIVMRVKEVEAAKGKAIFAFDGAAPIVRRSALEDVALPLRLADGKRRREHLDEDFFLYKEDVDLSWRLRLYGWEIVYSPKLIAYHARSSGSNAGRSHGAILRERRAIRPFAKKFAWRNQHLMQIKNELPSLVFRHLAFILVREVLLALYILFFEWYSISAIGDFFRLLPRAWAKRRIIMAHKRVGAREMALWFE